MEDRTIRIVQTTRPFGYVTPFPQEEHTLLVCVVDETVSEDERASISEAIVAAKCRYAVCWGYECSEWDTAIDYAHIATDPNFDPPNDAFVMTTWHDAEPIEDAIEFWWMNTCFEDYQSTNFAVLVIGEADSLTAKISNITSDLAQHWNNLTNNKKDNKSEQATPRKPSDLF